MSGPSVQINLDAESVHPVLQLLSESLLEQLKEQVRQEEPERLGYTEPEAAVMLGMKAHQLRDERLRGRVECYRVTGNGVRYSRQHLLDYLTRDKSEQPHQKS